MTRERRRRLLQTFCWFLLTLLLALFIPDIGRVISVIGGLAACFIFVFPGREKVSWLPGGRRVIFGFSAAGRQSSPCQGLDGLLWSRLQPGQFHSGFGDRTGEKGSQGCP